MAIRRSVAPVHLNVSPRSNLTRTSLLDPRVSLFRASHKPCLNVKPMPKTLPVATRNPVAAHPPVIRPAARFFATDSEVLRHFKKSEVKRVSIEEPRANELILAVRNGDYATATVLVKNQNVNVDGHTSHENTALADAAKRGDTRAVRFLLKDLKANPDASCDCPAHRTALHYAAQGGHTETVKVLLAHGAKLNALNSYGQSAIDVAKKEDVKQILLQHQESERKKLLELGGMPERKYFPK